MNPQRPAIFSSVPLLLVVLAMKTLVAFRGVSSHLVWPLKVWLILNFFQDLVYWLSKHSIDYLSISRSRMPRKISSRSIFIVPIWPKTPSILRDHLSFLISLLLVLLGLFILINTVHELTHTPNWFPGQRLSQIMLSGQADLKSPYGHIIEFLIDLIEHLPVSVRVCF